MNLGTQFSKLYRASGSPILVNTDIKTVVPTGYEIKERLVRLSTDAAGKFVYNLFAKQN